MSAIASRTTNYRLRTINFDWATWHDEMNANMRDIDTVLASISGLTDLGVWENSTAYVIGDRRIDEDTLDVYECNVNHTSHASNTFVQDRVANPTYWSQVNQTSVSGSTDFQFTYDTSTTTGADPGTGDFRLNNATLASATEITFSSTSQDTGNPDVSDFIASFDDYGASADRGFLTLRKQGDPSFFRIYRITGSVTDSTTYLTMTVVSVSGSGTLSSGDIVYFSFTPTGAAGTVGPPGADYTADAELNALAGLTSASGGLPAFTGSGTAALRTITGTANEIEVSNGNGVSGNPTLRLPTNVTMRGATDMSAGLATLKRCLEKGVTSATVATGTINFDVITQQILEYTSNASANWTLNVRGDGSNTLNSLMSTDDMITIVFMVKQGGTAYYHSAMTIDGNAQTVRWVNGVTPSSGNTNSVDRYTFTIRKSGSGTFVVTGSQTKLA